MSLGADTSFLGAQARRLGAGAEASRRPGRTLILITMAAAGAGLIGLGGTAWTTQATEAVSKPVRMQQQVSMVYDAVTSPGAAYPAGTLRTGDPVFLRLVPRMNVHIAYRTTVSDVNGPIVSGLHGTRRITAELRSPNGWHRGLELLPRQTFTGAGFDATATLDLAQVRKLITEVDRTTGITGQTYTLSIRNEIALAGSIFDRTGPIDRFGVRARTPLRDKFFPELTFDYDGRQLQLTDRSKDQVDEVVRDQTSTAFIPGRTAGRIPVLGVPLPVRPLRIGGPALGLMLLSAVWIGNRSRRSSSSIRPAASRPTTAATPVRPAPPERKVRRIVLDEAPPPTRPRVPGPRTAALAQQQWARTHPTARDRD